MVATPLTGAVFSAATVREKHQAAGRPYLEFLREPALSIGVYRLGVGEPDRQRPHDEDEVYYVIDGHGEVDIDGEVTPVSPGDTIYVAKHVPHHFQNHPAGIALLVFFAPPEGSAREREEKSV